MKSVHLINLCSGFIFLVCFVSTSSADYQQRKAAYEKGEYVIAIKDWRPLAERGDAEAQFNLGVSYEKGNGVQQDYAEAIRWYRLATAQGYVAAMWNLWEMYGRNLGVPRDPSKASQWFRQGAAEGDAVAQYILSGAYANGRYVPLDLVQAYMWLNLSAGQKFPGAVEDLGVLAKRLTPVQISEARKLVSAWKPKR